MASSPGFGSYAFYFTPTLILTMQLSLRALALCENKCGGIRAINTRFPYGSVVLADLAEQYA